MVQVCAKSVSFLIQVWATSRPSPTWSGTPFRTHFRTHFRTRFRTRRTQFQNPFQNPFQNLFQNPSHPISEPISEPSSEPVAPNFRTHFRTRFRTSRPPSAAVYTYSISYWGTSGRGVRSYDLSGGGARFPAVGGPAKWRGLPDCFRANHRRLSGSPGTAMKLLRKAPGALQEMGGLRSLANPARPLCLGGISRPVRGTECCPFFGQLGERNAALFFSSSHPGRSPVSSRGIPGMASEHRKQLRAGAAARPDIEMLHAEVRVVRVTEPHPPAERQPLARGVGDGVAEARAAQELGGREGLPVVQHDPLARLPHRDEAPLGHLPARPQV